MEYFAQVVEQIDFRITTIKFDIKEIEIHLHKQLNAGVTEELNIANGLSYLC